MWGVGGGTGADSIGFSCICNVLACVTVLYCSLSLLAACDCGTPSTFLFFFSNESLNLGPVSMVVVYGTLTLTKIHA